MAKALGIEATNITYQKYYAEYCALHNLGTPRQNKEHVEVETNQAGENEEQLECILLNQRSHDMSTSSQENNGMFNMYITRIPFIQYKGFIMLNIYFILKLLFSCD